jgi:hypothetical protein
MDDILKGNFKVKREVAAEEPAADASAAETIAEKLRKAALASLGGSMVYMERTALTWNGDDK